MLDKTAARCAHALQMRESGATLGAVAENMGVTRERVRQMIFIAKLHEELRRQDYPLQANAVIFGGIAFHNQVHWWHARGLPMRAANHLVRTGICSIDGAIASLSAPDAVRAPNLGKRGIAEALAALAQWQAGR